MSELSSCVKVEVAVLGSSPSPISLDNYGLCGRKATLKKKQRCTVQSTLKAREKPEARARTRERERERAHNADPSLPKGKVILKSSHFILTATVGQ